MRLKRFSATNVHGFLNFLIQFNDDLSFLVGVNGSGKTTALRLIHAILGPSFEEIYSIPFERLELTFDESGQERTISAVRRGDQISIGVDNISEILALPVLPPSAIDALSSPGQRNDSVVDALRVSNAGNATYKFLNGLTSPLFLGLERRQLTNQEEYDSPASHAERNRFIAERNLRDRKMPKGSLGASLSEVQLLIREAYRRLRQVQDKYANDLRQAVLLSAFRYTDFFARVGNSIPPTSAAAITDLQKLLGRKSEIRSALANIDATGEKVTKQLDDFFLRLEALQASLKEARDKDSFNIEWLMNKAQVERIDELISLIDQNKSQVDRLFSPIKTFLDTINFFYADTRKSVEVDAVGTLSIMRPDKQRASLEALSSGERQLLVIFGHLVFNRYGSQSNVVIIDEPELSLHLRWQENFVPKALAANPRVQLVLATHSPEIVSEYKAKCIQVSAI